MERTSSHGPAAQERPRVPPGQRVVQEWPVLHAGEVPEIDLDRWEFRVFGLVERPLRLSWEEFQRLPRVQVRSDIHCVTRWSRLDNRWEGVPFKVIAELARPLPQARYVMVHAYHGFTANLPLDDAMRDDVLFADHHDGKPLTPEHGWPLRLVVPHLYFWKSAKWVNGVEFMAEDRPGFWEQLGYHMRGDPWKEQRYWGD